jgi:hydrogenase/urease accessory protein HupE
VITPTTISRRFVGRAAICLVFLQSAFSAIAHNPGLSALDLRLTRGGVEATIAWYYSDIERLEPIDANRDGAVSPAEFVSALPRLEKLAARALEIVVDGQIAVAGPPEVEMDENKTIFFKLHYATRPKLKWRARSALLAEMPAGHRQYASAADPSGAILVEAILDGIRNALEIPVNARPRERSNFGFLVLGVGHILAGIDHLLFLAALLMVCESFWDVAKLVTSFTIAHSITLALAALEVVNIPSRVVEPAIAASIVYVGIENILRRPVPRTRVLVVFAFGLAHGFGFAGVLREMGIARAAGGAIGPLFCFNLGVELGQIAVAAPLVPLIWRLRRDPRFATRWAPAASALIAALGAFWFVQRIFAP